MLKIGFTMGFMPPDSNRKSFEKKHLSFIEDDMIRFFAKHNCLPIALFNLYEQYLDEYLNTIDGIVFTGGADLSPKSYNETLIEEGKWPGDYKRDQYEMRILKKALEKNIPILGICRGHQLINVYFGGSLYQDIETQISTKTTHRDGAVYDLNHHKINIIKEGYLSKFYEREVYVNSIHHQAIKKLAPNLKILAQSDEDGIIEAISSEDMSRQYILGVQWHPEFSYNLAGKVVDPFPLINDFLQACRLSQQKYLNPLKLLSS